MPTLSFTKMHGLGNDFVVINLLKQAYEFNSSLIAQLANRHTGIGFDQLLLIEPGEEATFFCRIFNADGSEAEQCGNGLRCVARYINEKGLLSHSTFSIATISGIFPIEITDYAHIKITMGTPDVNETLIELPIQNGPAFLPTSILKLGNPHAVIRVDSIDTTPIQQLAPDISAHAYFPQGVNVGFMQILKRDHIRLRTYERGAGETFACGSNACAAAMAGILNGWLDHTVTVQLHYGILQIDWEPERNVIHMTGPAESVFEGTIEV